MHNRTNVATSILFVALLLSMAMYGLLPNTVRVDQAVRASNEEMNYERGFFIAQQNFGYAPELDRIDISDKLLRLNSPLSNYYVVVDGERILASESIAEIAEKYAINPRVLAVMIEIASRSVTDPYAMIEEAAGYPLHEASSFTSQVELLAIRLIENYEYSHWNDNVVAEYTNGSIEDLDISLFNTSSLAIYRTLAEISTPTDIDRDVSEFVELYRLWFDDPQAVPAYLQSLNLPDNARLPYANNEGVHYSAGPHNPSSTDACVNQPISEMSAIDFSPGGFDILAIADGRLVRFENTGGPAGRIVVVEHAGGIQSMYWHLQEFSPELQDLESGAWIPQGFRLGVAGGSGGWPPHLHLDLRTGITQSSSIYLAPKVPWDGKSLDGWTFYALRWPNEPSQGVNYRGTAVRNGTSESITQEIRGVSCTSPVSGIAYVHTNYSNGTTAKSQGDTQFGFYSPNGDVPSTNKPLGVILYEHPNYGGYALALSENDLDLCDNHIDPSQPPVVPCFTAPSWTNNASSIRIAPGWAARLHKHNEEDTNYWGDDAYQGFACDQDIPDFRTETFPDGTPLNENVSRIYVWRCGETNNTGARTSRTLLENNPCEADPGPLADDAACISDSTLPDGDVFSPGQSLSQVWRVRNTGSTTWGSGYQLVFIGGDRMNAPASVSIPTVAPGYEADIAVPMTAPTAEGDYAGSWQLRNDQGTYFGDVLRVGITVLGDSIPAGDATNLVCTDCPDVVSPGQQFWPTIRAYVNAGQLQGVNLRGDMLRHKAGDRYGAYEFVAVSGSDVVNAGEFYDFTFYNEHPITAPSAEGIYETTWQIWRDNHWDGEEIVIRFQVSNSGGTAPDPPTLTSPSNWHVSYDGSTPQLCASASGSVEYWFQIYDSHDIPESGWISSSCWTPPGLGAYGYQWHVKVRDSNTGLESNWSETRHFSIASQELSVQDFQFSPGSPSASDEVNVYTCVDGFGGIGLGLYIYANTATDGSANGDWYWIDPKGTFCYDPAKPWEWPQWHTRALADGTHLIRAVGFHGTHEAGTYQEVVRETTYTLLRRRPSNIQLINPGQDAWLNSRRVTFRWMPEETDRVNEFRFQVSTNSDPSVNPIIDEVLSSTTYEYTFTFSEDYPDLYWGVMACNEIGCGDKAVGHFGIDRQPPAAAVNNLPTASYETVIAVEWNGNDNASGIRWYDVQYRDGERGEWIDWQNSVETTVAIFRGHPGHTYYFRARALDLAGNLSTYAADDGNTQTTIDPTAAPSPPWWNPAYASKRNILLVNDDTDTLVAGYPVRLYFDNSTTPTASELYAASLSSVKGSDFRIVYDNTTELNRVVRTFTSSVIEIWFNTQTNIPGSGSDATHYQLYYGNSAATNPPGTINDIFPPANDSHTVGLWHFQEGSGTTIVDSSGNGHNATIQVQSGGGNYEWITDGQMGRALRFFNQPQDGNGAWAEVSNGSAFALPQFTAEAWVRVDVNGVERTIAAKRYGTGIAWQLFLQDGKPACEYNYHRAMPVGDHLAPGEWYHIACTYDGSTLRVYRNGQIVRSEMFSAGPLVDSSPLRFGKNADNSNFLNGAIQHIRISDIARSSFPEAQWAQITSQPGAALGDQIDPPIFGDADLAILDFGAYLPNASLGEGVIVQAVVRNEGDAPTQNGFYTDIYADHLPTGAGDYTGSVRFLINDPIESGETVTLTTLVSDAAVARSRAPLAPLSEVETMLYAQTDSGGVIDELDEADNISSGVSICMATADAYEDDNTPENATPVGDGITLQQHNFHSAGDDDWYALSATAGARYVLRTYNLEPFADTYIYLFDTDGQTLLAANDDYDGSLASYLEWIAPSDETYYVRVSHWNPKAGGCATGYDVSIRQISHIYLPVLLQNYAPMPPTPELDFYETFDSNVNGWQTHQADCCLDACFDAREHLSYKYSLWLEGGRYHVNVPLDCRANPDENHGDTRHIMPVTLAPSVHRPLSQTCIQARGSLEQWDAYWSFWGLAFAASENMYTVYSLEVNNLGDWAIIRRDGYEFPGLNHPLDDLNSQTRIAEYSGGQRDPAVSYPSANTLRVRIYGDTVVAYINGQEVDRFTHDAISELRYVGLIGGDWEMTPTQIGYDYFYVDEGCDDY